MVLADTHLLGSRNGHWFDKLRREWQMHRAFQTAQTYFSPQHVFFLGDLQLNLTTMSKDFIPCFRRVKRPESMFCPATMIWDFIMPSVLTWTRGSRPHLRLRLCS